MRTRAVVYKEHLFIGDTTQGFFFAVFDTTGKKSYEIKKQHDKIPVSEEYKNWLIDSAKKNMRTQNWKRFKHRYNIEFSDYLPAYANFAIADDKIYVFRPAVIEKQELEVLDLKGRLLFTKSISFIDGMGIDQGWDWSLSVEDGKLYYMKFDVDKEDWEMHYIKIGKD